MTTEAQPFVSLSYQLGDFFVNNGLLSFDQLDVVRKEQRLQGLSFEDCLLNLGLISESALAEAISSTSGYEKVNLKLTLLDPSLKTLVPQELAEQFCIMPLSLEEGILRIALADVFDLNALDYLRHHLPSLQRIIPLIAPESDIMETIYPIKMKVLD